MRYIIVAKERGYIDGIKPYTFTTSRKLAKQFSLVYAIETISILKEITNYKMWVEMP